MEQPDNTASNSPSNNTELPKNNSNTPSHSKNLIFIFLGLVIAIILVLKVVYLMVSKNTIQENQATITPSPQAISSTSFNNACEDYENTQFYKNTRHSGQVLISEVPNFENISDVIYDGLPHFWTDVRDIYNYKGNFIISGFNKVVKYDPIRKIIIWQNDNRVLKSIHDAVPMGDYLFVSSNRVIDDYSDESRPGPFYSDGHGRKVLKIDINKRKIVKVCFENENTKKLANLRLFTANNFVWGDSWDGVLRLDPKDDSISFYAISDFLKLGKEYASAYYRKINRSYPQDEPQLSDFGIELPKYIAISAKISNKYYLFSKDAVHTLVKSAFPKLYRKTNTFDVLSYLTHVFISSNENYALLISSTVGGFPQENPTVDTTIFAVVVDLNSGESLDLLKDHPLAKQALTKYWEDRIYKINYVPGFIFQETEKGVSLKEGDTKKEILFVNFLEKKLEFR